MFHVKQSAVLSKNSGLEFLYSNPYTDEDSAMQENAAWRLDQRNTDKRNIEGV